jgi:hypothetical protein
LWRTYIFTFSYTGPDLNAVSQCDHAAFKVRVWDCRTGRVAKSVPSSPEILSEEPHHDERVESETAIAQQIPNFHARSKGERILVRAASGKKEAKYESIVSRLAFGSAACSPA